MKMIEESIDMVVHLLGELLDNVVIGIADFIDGLELPQWFAQADPSVVAGHSGLPVELTEHGGTEL